MRLLKWIGGTTVAVAVAGLVVGGLVAVPVADGVDQYFSSDQFCANTCHVMTATVAQELYETKHWTTPTGVRATCRDCHVSEGLTAAMWDHMLGTKELFAFVFEGIRTPEDFEDVRFKAANRVRLQMLADDSKNCRSCHVMAAIQPERKRGQRQHKAAREEGITCIACHYNLVHKDVPPSDDFKEAISSQ